MFKVTNTSKTSAKFWNRNNTALTHLAPGQTSDPVDVNPDAPEFAKESGLKLDAVTAPASKPPAPPPAA